MTREQSLQVIRDAFSHIVIERITVEFDPLVKEDVAKVYVNDDQFDAALGEDGFYPRGVAMKAGLAIEVSSSANEFAWELLGTTERMAPIAWVSGTPPSVVGRDWRCGCKIPAR